MSHYFENDTSLISKKRIIDFQIGNKMLHFISDNGVFCKNHIDEGTRAILNVLVSYQIKGNVLDLGCGYGVIGLTLAIFNETINVTLSDINQRAINLCQENIINLKLENRAKCLISNVYENIDETFDNIVINPPIRAGKHITYSMYLGAYEHLNNNGNLFIVIRKAQGAASAFKYLESLFESVCLLDKHKGYWIIQAKKIIKEPADVKRK